MAQVFWHICINRNLVIFGQLAVGVHSSVWSLAFKETFIYAGKYFAEHACNFSTTPFFSF